MKGFLYRLYLIVGALVGSLLNLYYSTGWVFFFYKIFHLFLLSMDAYAGFFLSIFYLFLFRGCRAQPFLNCLVFLIFYSRNVVYIEWK